MVIIIIHVFINYTINGTERIYEFQIACQTRAYTGLAEAYLLDICVFVMQDTQDLGVMQVIYKYFILRERTVAIVISLIKGCC
jgi:hypothetical protein